MPNLPLLPFWISFLVSALVAYPIYKLLLRLKSRQTISQHAPEGHQIKQGTPTMGGLIIVVGVLAGIIVAAFTPERASSSQPGTNLSIDIQGVVGVLTLLLGYALIGFIDDFVVPRMFVGKRGLGWKQKILMQIFVAVLGAGLMLDWAVTAQAGVYVFLILFCANAYNFLDGLDALSGSVLLVLCGGLLAIAGLIDPFGWNSRLLLPLIGATIPFLFLNAPPAKIFMGDAGSLPIGALLGVVFSNLLSVGEAGWTFYTPYATMSTGVTAQAGPALIVSLLIVGFVLIAELVPVPLQIFWVKVFKRKLFLYTPIHHAFEKKGWAETRVVWSFVLAQLILSVTAYSIMLAALRSGEAASQQSHYYYNPSGVLTESP